MKDQSLPKPSRHRERLFQRIRQHWVVAAAGLIGVALGGALQIVGNVKALFAPDAIEVATEQSKEAISREFVEVSWKRLYRSRAFVARLKRSASEQEIDAAWNAMLETVEQMASKVMIFAGTFGKFYGSSWRNEYEYGIQPDFVNVTEKIVDLRYRLKQKRISSEEVACEIAHIENAFELLNIRLYKFVNCFDPRKNTDLTCQVAGGQTIEFKRPVPPACPSTAGN
ncbi:MAG: hypothetical protein WB822_02130 [Rhodoplanes sp.]